MTEFVWDDAGKLTSAVTTREPEWSQADIDLLVASRLRDDSMGVHGQPLDEAMSPLADPSNDKARWGYETYVERDFAAKAKADGEELLRKSLPEGSSMAGLVVRVRKKWLG